MSKKNASSSGNYKQHKQVSLLKKIAILFSVILVMGVVVCIFPDQTIRFFKQAREKVENLKTGDEKDTLRQKNSRALENIPLSEEGVGEKAVGGGGTITELENTKARNLIGSGDARAEMLKYDEAISAYKKVEYLNVDKAITAEARKKSRRAAEFKELVSRMKPNLLSRSVVYRVFLENGNVLEGTIRSETDFKMELGLNNGVTLQLNKSMIRKKERVAPQERDRQLEAAFRDKEAELESPNAVALYRLARWAYENGVRGRVHEMLSRAADKTADLRSDVENYYARKLYLRAVWYSTLGQRYNMKKCINEIKDDYPRTNFAMLVDKDEMLSGASVEDNFTIEIADTGAKAGNSSLQVASVDTKSYKTTKQKPDRKKNRGAEEKKIRMPSVNTSGNKDFEQAEKYLKVALGHGQEAMKDLTSRRGQHELVKGRAAVDRAIKYFLRAKRTMGGNPQLEARLNKAMRLRYFFEKSKGVL